MESFESSFKVLSTIDIKNNEVAKPEIVKVRMTREKQEYIKKLMFSALEDPRAKYEVITTDQMEEEWNNPKPIY